MLHSRWFEDDAMSGSELDLQPCLRVETVRYDQLSPILTCRHSYVDADVTHALRSFVHMRRDQAVVWEVEEVEVVTTVHILVGCVGELGYGQTQPLPQVRKRIRVGTNT